jgi:hypothetical protein
MSPIVGCQLRLLRILCRDGVCNCNDAVMSPDYLPLAVALLDQFIQRNLVSLKLPEGTRVELSSGCVYLCRYASSQQVRLDSRALSVFYWSQN